MKILRMAQKHRRKPAKWFHRRRHAHDPMLVLNMSIFNSERSWEPVFNPMASRENVWA